MNAACLSLLVWISMILLFWGEHVMCSEKRCPVYDREWQNRDQQCDPDKKYHCFENEENEVVAEGCYVEKLCLKGAHPVVENKHIRCALCLEGYQPNPRLSSSTFQYSYCYAYGRACNPEYGESLCHAGTAEMDRACTCNATLGFSAKVEGENCSCFTDNGYCAGCRFTGCPDGSSPNSRGFCEPDPIMVSTTTPSKNLITTSPSPLTTTPAPLEGDDDDNTGLVVGLTVSLLVIIIIIGLLLWKCGILKICRQKICNASSDTSDKPDAEEAMIKQNGSSSDRSKTSDIVEKEKLQKEEDIAGTQEQMSAGTQNGLQIFNLQVGTATFKLSASDSTKINVDAVHTKFMVHETELPYGTTQGDPSTPQMDPSRPGSTQEGLSTPQRGPSRPGTTQGGPSTAQRGPSRPGSTQEGPSTPQRGPSRPDTTQGGPSTPQRGPSCPSGPTQGDPSTPQSASDARLPSVSSSHPPPESTSSPQPSAPFPSLPVPSAPPLSLPEASAPPSSLPVVDQSQEEEESNTALDTSNTWDERDHSGDGDDDETLRKSLRCERVTDQSGDDETQMKQSFSEEVTDQSSDDETHKEQLFNEMRIMSREEISPQIMKSGDGIHTEEYKDMTLGASVHELEKASLPAVLTLWSSTPTPTSWDNEIDSALKRDDRA